MIKQRFYELDKNKHCFDDKNLVVLNEIGNGIAIKEARRMGQCSDCIYSGNQNRNCFNDKQIIVFNEIGNGIVI